jgi:hypothetical protein
MMVLFAAAISLIAAPAQPASMFAGKPLNPLLSAPLDFSSVNISLDRLSSCSDYLTKAKAGDRSAALHRLGDLPDANREIAVNQISPVSGCAVPLIVRYGVSR